MIFFGRDGNLGGELTREGNVEADSMGGSDWRALGEMVTWVEN